MKVGYIQYDVKHNLTENLNLIENYLEKATADIILFPELCNCGYLFENKKALQDISETVPNGKTVSVFESFSKKYNNTLIFGMAEKENDKVYNTAVIVSKGIYIGKYRKIHLSDFEKKFFNKGEKNQVFEIDGIKIGVQICFDLWFPEISREQIRKGAKILFSLCNFGGETTYNIAKIRAIENLTPLVLCNRIGSEKLPDMDADFLGKSSVINSKGERIIEANGTSIDVCEIDINNKMSNVICSDFEKEINFHYDEI